MEEKFKPVLKYLKEHENGVSVILGVMVVIVAGVLLLNISKRGVNGQSLDQTTELTLTTEGIESLLAEEPEVTPTTGASFLEQAGKAILGILGIKNAITETPSEPTISGEQSVELVEQADGTLMPKDIPQSYTVKEGDSLWKIAETYYQSGYNWVDIAQANQLKNADRLNAGQTITLPNVRVRVPLDGLKTVTVSKTTPVDAEQVTANVYKVEKGDSLWTISVKAYNDGFKWTKIFAANQNKIVKAGVIEPGWELTIPRN